MDQVDLKGGSALRDAPGRVPSPPPFPTAALLVRSHPNGWTAGRGQALSQASTVMLWFWEMLQSPGSRQEELIEATKEQDSRLGLGLLPCS